MSMHHINQCGKLPKLLHWQLEIPDPSADRLNCAVYRLNFVY